MWLQPETATASILCERHNGQLAPLDAFASALDDELSRIHEGAPLGQGVSTVARFYGPNLERWLMKTLCGFATARSGVFAPGQSMFVAPEEWVRFLFAETDLSAPAGVYLSAAVGESFAMDPKGFTFTSLHAQGLLSGLMVDMRNVRFMFISIPWQGTIGGVLNEASVRRPWKITFRSREVESQIEFEWPGECGPEVRYGYVFTGMSNREDPLEVSGDIVNTRPSGTTLR